MHLRKHKLYLFEVNIFGIINIAKWMSRKMFVLYLSSISIWFQRIIIFFQLIQWSALKHSHVMKDFEILPSEWTKELNERNYLPYEGEVQGECYRHYISIYNLCLLQLVLVFNIFVIAQICSNIMFLNKWWSIPNQSCLVI